MYRNMRDNDEDDELKNELEIAKNFNGLKSIDETEELEKRDDDKSCIDNRYLVSEEDY